MAKACRYSPRKLLGGGAALASLGEPLLLHCMIVSRAVQVLGITRTATRPNCKVCRDMLTLYGVPHLPVQAVCTRLAPCSSRMHLVLLVRTVCQKAFACMVPCTTVEAFCCSRLRTGKMYDDANAAYSFFSTMICVPPSDGICKALTKCCCCCCCHALCFVQLER